MKYNLIFILLVANMFPVAGQRVKKAHKDIVSAAELMHNAFEDYSREIIDSLLFINPINSDALFLRSLDYWHYGKIHQAIDNCNKAIENHSRECYYDLGYLYYNRGDMYYSYSLNYDKAIADYTTALTLIKNRDYLRRSYIHYYRALCYLELSDYKNAKIDLLKALEYENATLQNEILKLLAHIDQKGAI